MDLMRKLASNKAGTIFLLQKIVNELDKNDPSTAASCRKYVAENPYDGIGMFVHLMQKMKENTTKLVWNWGRLQEVAETVTALEKFVADTLPHAEMTAEFDVWLQRHIVVSVQSEQYSEWALFQADMPKYIDIMQKVDELVVSPQLNEQFLMTFVFKDVRKIA